MTASQEYVREEEETVSQFSAELLRIQDPLLHQQCATSPVTPAVEVTSIKFLFLFILQLHFTGLSVVYSILNSIIDKYIVIVCIINWESVNRMHLGVLPV
jgi:hypothetical protein